MFKLKIALPSYSKWLPIFIALFFQVFLLSAYAFTAELSAVAPYVNLTFSLYFMLSIRKIRRCNLIAFCLSAICILAVSAVNGSSAGAASSFLALFIYISCFRQDELPVSFASCVFLLIACLLCRQLALSKSRYEIFMTGDADINPNGVAIIILVCFILIDSFLSLKTPRPFLTLLFLYWALLCDIFLLRSRASLLGILTYGILNLGKEPLLKRSRNVMLIAFAAVIILGCLFPFAYVSLKTSGADANMTDISQNMFQKNLYTGRDLIWANLTHELRSRPLALWIGLGSGMQRAIGQGLSMHNSFLAILLNYGLCGVSIYLLFILFTVREVYRKSKSLITDAQYKLLTGYLSLLFVSWAEDVILTPYIMMLTNLPLALALNPYFCRKDKIFARRVKR